MPKNGSLVVLAFGLALVASGLRSSARADAGPEGGGSLCGNGVIDPGEQCDEKQLNGNLMLSCCSATCQIEPGGTMCGCMCGSMECDGRGGGFNHCISACGDVNRDVAVDIGDALVIAQYDVGLLPCGGGAFKNPVVCDINGDGACDIGDALRIAQCTVGLVSCNFTPCRDFTCP